MRQRRVEALQRCAKRAEAMGFPMASTVNPFAPEPPPTMHGSTLLKVAADVTGVPVRDMIGDDRRPDVHIPRDFACWLIARRAGRTTGQIAHMINKSTWTARHAIRRTDQRLADDWPMVVGWRNRAAEIVGRIDTHARRQQEHTGTAGGLSARCTG